MEPVALTDVYTHPAWHTLWSAITAGHLPHALLISNRAPAMVLNAAFSRALTFALFCDKPASTGQSCQICQNCVLIQAGNHPDIRMIEPEEGSRVIKIDQIREFIGFITLTSHHHAHKLGLITPADALNTSAANSLLKILEEPPMGAVIVLLSDQPMLLPITIRSRCQHIRLSGHHDSDHLAQSMQLTAVELGYGEDLEQLWQGRAEPVEIAEKWVKAGVAESLDVLSRLLVVWIKEASTSLLPYSASRPALTELNRHYERLLKCRHLQTVSNVAPAILLESISMQWSREK